MPSCCTIRYLDRQTKDELKALYSESDIFIYGTRLDTWGLTVMEAMINKLPVILLPYAAWEHIYPEQFITTQLVKRIEFILMNYLQEADEAYTFAKQFSLEHIGKKRFTLLNTNDV
jgi:glycosyltransferase involved in cell wall biosynthesis